MMYFTTDSGSSNNDVKIIGSSEVVGGAITTGFDMVSIGGNLRLFVDLVAPTRTRSEINFQEQKRAFMDIPPLLLQEYKGEFVASLNGRLVDHDSDYVALVHRFFRSFGDVPVYITKIGERPIATIDTPFVD